MEGPSYAAELWWARYLTTTGALYLLAAVLTPLIRHVPFLVAWHFVPVVSGSWIMGLTFVVNGSLKLGFLRHCEGMLNSIEWRGDENVLEVGTGRGMIMIAVAKRLTTGTSSGVDMRKAAGVVSRRSEYTRRIAGREGVADKIDLREADARALPFADASFDVVFCNSCLHNISFSDGRIQACREIARVLKPGGTALVADFKDTKEYAKVFREAGLQVQLDAPNWWDTLLPLRVVRAHK